MRLRMRDIWRAGRGRMRPRVVVGLRILAFASLATRALAELDLLRRQHPPSAGSSPDRRRRGSPEHRVRAHRRPVDEPPAVHAQRAQMQRYGADVQRLLRVGLAVLSVALLDFTGNFPYHEGVRQRRVRSAVSRQFYDRGAGAAHVRDRAPARGLQHRDDGQVPQRLRQDKGSVPGPRSRTCCPAGRTGTWPGLGLSRSSTTRCNEGRHGRQLSATKPSRRPHRRSEKGVDFINSSAAPRKAVLPRGPPPRRTIPTRGRRPTHNVFPGPAGPATRPPFDVLPTNVPRGQRAVHR